MRCAAVILSLLLYSSLFLQGCDNNEPVKIGFMASTSGKIAQLGQSARDGTILAIEDFNAHGGLKGKDVVLESFDTHFEELKAKEGVRFLKEKGVAAIIGPVASQMAAPIVKEANVLKIPVVSPTVTTPELSNLQDFFFRVYLSLTKNAQDLASYAVNQKQLKTFVVIWDAANRTFSKPWQETFTRRAKELNAEVIDVIEINSKDIQDSFLEIVKEIPLSKIDGALIIAGPIDTAMFCQQIRKINSSVAIMGSEWSYAGTLAEFGGKTVEGFTFTTGINMQSTAPAFVKFKESYVQRFLEEPNFPAVLSYEATTYLLSALAETDNARSLPDKLVNMKSFQGLQGTIELNQFGDASRAVFINEIRNGEFKNITQVE